MLKYGTKVRIAVECELKGLEGVVAHPLVVEIICNKLGDVFRFGDGNCVLFNIGAGGYFWFKDEELEEINA